MPPVPSLPLELIHEILRHLWATIDFSSKRGVFRPWIKSKRDMASCSLVSHSWHRCAQPLLFCSFRYIFALADISMTRDEDIDVDEIRTLRKLFDFLQQSPNICQHVRSLTLEKDSIFNDRTEVEGMTDIFISILMLLPQVRNLEIDFMPIVPLEIQNRKLPHTFDQVLINWMDSESSKPHQGLRLLSLFGDVDELHLPSGGFILRRPLDRSLFPKRLKVNKLFAHVSTWMPVLDALLETASLESAQVLDLRFVTRPFDDPISHKWANRASQTLVHLKIRLCDRTTYKPDALAHCPHLQTLVFNVECRWRSEPDNPRNVDDSLWHAMEHTLTHIIRTPPAHLRLLSYKLHVGSKVPPFEPRTGNKADDALYELANKLEVARTGQPEGGQTREPFKVLIRLAGRNGPVTLDDTSLDRAPRAVIEAAVVEYTTQVQDLIRASLPKLNGAGVLQFDQV